MSELRRLDRLYQDIVLDHYRNPRNSERLSQPSAEASIDNPFCGDEVTVQLDAQGETVDPVAVFGRGCSISQASASLMSETITGKSSREIREIAGAFHRLMRGECLSDREREALGELLALEDVRKYPVRIKCALLGWGALDDALDRLDRV